MTDGTVVLGLGNLILSDEGVGVKAIRRLVSDARVPANVTLVDGGTLGLELLSYAAEAEHLLLIDAVDVSREPGTVVRFDQAALKGLPGGATMHQVGAADLLSTMYLMGHEPAAIVLLGVQPASTNLGVDLTPPVEAALDRLVDAAIAELTRWGSEGESSCMK
jgi:hydrogenase maturation protease